MLDNGAGTLLGTLDQNADGRSESRIGHEVDRGIVDPDVGQRDAHFHLGDAAEQLVEVFQRSGTAGEDDSVGEFGGIARILDLLHHELGDVGSARLDDGGEVFQQNILGVARGAAVDTDKFVLGRKLGDGRTVLALEVLDVLLGHAHGADVAVDGRSAHGDGDGIADDVAVVDRYVGDAGAEVDDSDALLHLLGLQDGGRSGQGIGEDAKHLDAQTLECHIETLHGRLVAEDEVEGGRELLAERADRVLDLLIVVDHIVLRDALHDGLVVGSLDVAHAVEQRLDILLVDARLMIGDEDMVGMARAPHEIARDAGIGLGDPDAQLRLDLGDRIADGPADQLDVVDAPGIDSLHGLRDDGRDTERAPVARLADGDDHGRRTQIDGYDIVFSFHA